MDDAGWIDRFIRHLEYERRLSPLTCKNYRRDLEMLRDFAQSCDIAGWDGLDEEHIRSYSAASFRKGQSARSIQRRLSAARTFFRYLIREKFVEPQTDTLIKKVLGLPKPDKAQKKLLELFQEMGSDLSIVTYVFNFSTADGINRDLQLMNRVNDLIFNQLSLHPDDSGKLPRAPMFVTASTFDPGDYGPALVKDFAQRAGVDPVDGEAVRFLISTTQNPWLSTTTRGDEMLNKVIDILRETAFKAANEVLQASCQGARAK